MPKTILAAALVALAAAAALPAAAEKRMAIATAGTAGALYPMGVALARTINQQVPGFAASAEASSASLENLRNLSEGKVEWGISQNEVAWMAFQGKGKYQGRPVESLRSLFGTLISWAQVFAPADSAIASVADLKGKRVGVGAPGSGGERAAHTLLAHYGLSYDDVEARFMSNPEMVSALKDGSLDAFIITHPLRSAALMDLTSSFRAKLVPVAEAGFYQAHPYFTRREVPAGTYPGQDKPVPTPTSRIVMYTSTKAGFSAEEVAALLAGIWDHADRWTGVHPAVERYTSLSQALEGLNVPLHPGAARFYRQRGLEVPARLAP
jgi:hypothetical protein